MKVSVDLSRCESHGVCTGIAPDVFELGDDDILRVIRLSPTANSFDVVERAALMCPKQAITIAR